MDFEQIAKRLEWLDDERRKDKTTIATLEKRIAALEGSVPEVRDQLKEINSQVARIEAALGRIDQLEENLAKIKVEHSRSLETIEKQRVDRDREADKVRREDLESLHKAIGETRKELEGMPEMRTKIQARIEEEYRLGRLITELDKKFTENQRADEEYRRSIKMLEEGRRQDTKRLTDLSAETSVLRKRLDEQRGKVDVAVDSVRKLELRVNEFAAMESERKQAQVAFIEKQSMQNLERERSWKEWQTQFETISRQALDLESQMQALDATHRTVKRAQESFEETRQRFERRLNEITEMQRLVEERFRNEWVNFKSDDQKRWTNYTISQEEQQRELNRKFEKQTERLVKIEDLSQEMHDTIEAMINDTRQRLQKVLALSQEILENNQQSFSG
jgi:chromosome segregation ATPase